MSSEMVLNANAPVDARKARIALLRKLKRYAKPDISKALGQLANSFGPYLLLWGIMIYLQKHHYSYGLVLALSALTAGFGARIFIIFHDCGHGCFFANKRANEIIGFICGVITSTPSSHWWRRHWDHHATSGNLDHRGVGDVWTLTVQEFLDAPWWRQRWYRIFRNPFILFIIGPFVLFFISHRIPQKGSNWKEIKSVLMTDVALGVVFMVGWKLLGWDFFRIYVPVLGFAAIAGVWLFFVQHQYKDTYWVSEVEWDPVQAALQGSSYYKLPKILQWFSGNIGLHHIHHLRADIPNYNLQRCLDAEEDVQVPPLTLWRSKECATFSLWDEADEVMISFRELRRRKRNIICN